MNSLLIILVLTTTSMATPANDPNDPCFTPTNPACNLLKLMPETLQEFNKNYFQEANDLLENFTNLATSEIAKKLKHGSATSKKIIEIFAKRDLKDNARALAIFMRSQRLIYESFKLIPNIDEHGAAKSVLPNQPIGNLLIDAMLKQSDKIDKNKLPDVLSHLSSAIEHGEVFAKNAKGDLQKSVQDMTSRIKSLHKLLSDKKKN